MFPLCLDSTALSCNPPSNHSGGKKENLVSNISNKIAWLVGSRWLVFGQIPTLSSGEDMVEGKVGSLRKTFVLFPQRGEGSKWQAGKNNRCPTLPSTYVVGSHMNEGISFHKVPEMRSRPLAWALQESRFRLTPKRIFHSQNHKQLK